MWLQEIEKVVKSIHLLLGYGPRNANDDVIIKEQSQRVFKTFNQGESDVITKEEFLESCICVSERIDQNICRCMDECGFMGCACQCYNGRLLRGLFLNKFHADDEEMNLTL